MLTTVTIKDGDVEKKYVSFEDYEELEKEKEELKKDWVEANSRYFASCRELDRLKKKLEEAKETIDELERKLDEEEKKYWELYAVYDRSDSEPSEEQHKITDLERKLDRERCWCKLFMKKHTKTAQEYNSLEKDYQALSEKLNAANKRIAELETERKSLMSALNSVYGLTACALPADLFEDYMEQFDPDISD